MTEVKRTYGIKRICQYAIRLLANMPFPRQYRGFMYKWGGVDIHNAKTVCIGRNVSFDGLFPGKIHISNSVNITNGCVLLSHFWTFKDGQFCYSAGDVYIGEGVQLGTNTIICKPISIGDNSIVGAGSVVTKDIPANEIWAGNPARFIRRKTDK